MGETRSPAIHQPRGTVIITIIATIIVLGVLIFVHELGHFLMAKKAKVSVSIFSLGFGPKLFGKKVGETLYQVSLIPLGGYVKMVGEDLAENVPSEQLARSFFAQPVAKRLGIVIAGPCFNFLFAVVAFAAIFMVGMPTLLPEVGEVKTGYPAYQAGLQKGDRILEVDGTPIKRWEALAEVIHRSGGRPLPLTIERGGTKIQVSVTPQLSTQKNLFGEDEPMGQIGITPSGKTFIDRSDPFTATYKGLAQSWQIMELTVVSLVKMIEEKVSAKNIGGPILIAQLAGEQAKAGMLSFVIFIALISINLVVLNVLPIPILDGWLILLFIIEAVRGKPVSLHLRERAQQIGVFIIILIMLLVFYNDLSRILGVK